jgi:hypothetical protein
MLVRTNKSNTHQLLLSVSVERAVVEGLEGLGSLVASNSEVVRTR